MKHNYFLIYIILEETMITLNEVYKAIQTGNLSPVREYWNDYKNDKNILRDFIAPGFLCEAVRNEQLEVVHFLLEKGVSPFIAEKRFNNEKECYEEYTTPLHIAAEKNNLKILQLFLKLENSCVAVNMGDKNNNTPLHIAAKFSALESAQLLIINGSNPELKNNKNHMAENLAPEHWPGLMTLFKVKCIFKLITSGDKNKIEKLKHLKLTDSQLSETLEFVANEKINDKSLIMYLSKQISNPTYSYGGYWKLAYNTPLFVIFKMDDQYELFKDLLEKAEKNYLEDLNRIRGDLILKACKENKISILKLLIKNIEINSMEEVNKFEIFKALEHVCIKEPSKSMLKELLSKINMTKDQKKFWKKFNLFEAYLEWTFLHENSAFKLQEFLGRQGEILKILSEYKNKEYLKQGAMDLFLLGGASLGVFCTYKMYKNFRKKAPDTEVKVSKETENSSTNPNTDQLDESQNKMAVSTSNKLSFIPTKRSYHTVTNNKPLGFQQKPLVWSGPKLSGFSNFKHVNLVLSMRRLIRK